VDAQRFAAMPLFSDLPEDELTAMAAVAEEIEMPEGGTLTAEGDFGHAVFVIESGSADVTCDGEMLCSLGAGDVVGEIAVLASGRRSATVVATSPMRLITMFKRDVWRLEREAPGAARRLRELLAQRTATSS
jgi:CRP-like cAMP-binding protein